MTASRSLLAPIAVAVALAGCQLHGPSTDTVEGVARQAVETLAPPAWANQVGGSDRIADVAERTVSSVVHIASTREVQTGMGDMPFMFQQQRAPRPYRQRGAGSGVIIDASGLILTNNHVIDSATELVVTLSDGRKFDAHVKGTDPDTDLAIVELDGAAAPRDLPAMRLGDSNALRLGEVVLAIGSPFELQGSVTMGIVSAKDRTGFDGLATYQDYIQTDAAINPGNSGGALVNLEGELIGINTAIRSQSGGYDGIGFAIPSNLAQDVLTRLLRDGRVVRGYLGVGIEDVDPGAATLLGLSRSSGAIISQVMPGSAADKAGLVPYDVIVAIDDEPIDSANDLRNTVALKGANGDIRVEVVRDGKSRTLRAHLDERPDSGAPDGNAAPTPAGGLLEGVSLAPLDDQMRHRLGADDTLKGGAVVTQLDPSSRAAEAGLAPGDVIVEVNRVAVGSVKAIAAAVEGADRVMLLIERQGNRRVVFLE